MDTIDTEVIVVGGGVVGLSIAAQLAGFGLETILIEKNKVLGEEVSARNSGVIHAGFYYPQDSLKSQMCNVGNKAIYNYCKERNIYAKRTGKLLVSKDANAKKLFDYYIKNARSVGAASLRILGCKDISDLEPAVTADYGLLSPETGVLDVHGYIAELEKDFHACNGLISLKTKWLDSEKSGQFFASTLVSGDEEFQVKSRFIVFCTGLHSFSQSKAQLFKHVDLIKNVNFTKGHYFKLSGATPFNHLIYPLPTQFGLGIHATFDVDGSVRFGPDTALSKDIDYSFNIGVKDKLVSAIKEYWPDVLAGNLHEDYVGIRPKIQNSDEIFTDFSILDVGDHGVENCIFLQGIESPGLTCSIPIGRYVCSKLIGK